jgi:hypothetical protein
MPSCSTLVKKFIIFNFFNGTIDSFKMITIGTFPAIFQAPVAGTIIGPKKPKKRNCHDNEQCNETERRDELASFLSRPALANQIFLLWSCDKF